MIKFRDTAEMELWDRVVMIYLSDSKEVSTATSDADRFIEARRERLFLMPAFIEYSQSGIPR